MTNPNLQRHRNAPKIQIQYTKITWKIQIQTSNYTEMHKKYKSDTEKLHSGLHGESRNTVQIHGGYRKNTRRIQIHTPKPKNYTKNANHMHKTYENVRAAFGRPTKGAGAFGARFVFTFSYVLCM